MSEKRFTWKIEKLQHLDDEVLMVVDNENKEWKGHFLNIVDLLNEQQATINKLKSDIEETEISIKLFEDDVNRLSKENEQLRQQLKEKEEDEKLYANEIVELRKTNEEWLQFKDLGGDY